MKRRKAKRFLGRNSEGEIQVARVEGDWVIDAHGKYYLDFTMGWSVGNLGWANPQLRRAFETFHGPDYVSPNFAYQPWEELAGLLVSLAPPDLERCFRTTGGSEAVDLALQAAMIHTGRGKFVALAGCYHGNTIAGLSVGALEERECCENRLRHCAVIDPPLNEKALDRIERHLRRRDVAAFIMEPIPINLGVLIPEPAFMSGLQKLCRKHGTLLIMDEVATGFGRTGKLFASQHFDLAPDMMCLAKAITNGIAPMGALLTSRAVAKSMEKNGSFYSTYGWHPRSVAAALATVRYFADHQDTLFNGVGEQSSWFRERLLQLQSKRVGDVRVKGFAIGLDVDSERAATKIQKRCREAGLLIADEGSTLLLLPALTIDPKLAEKGVAILGRCL